MLKQAEDEDEENYLVLSILYVLSIEAENKNEGSRPLTRAYGVDTYWNCGLLSFTRRDGLGLDYVQAAAETDDNEQTARSAQN